MIPLNIIIKIFKYLPSFFDFEANDPKFLELRLLRKKIAEAFCPKMIIFKINAKNPNPREFDEFLNKNPHINAIKTYKPNLRGYNLTKIKKIHFVFNKYKEFIFEKIINHKYFNGHDFLEKLVIELNVKKNEIRSANRLYIVENAKLKKFKFINNSNLSIDILHIPSSLKVIKLQNLNLNLICDIKNLSELHLNDKMVIENFNAALAEFK